MAFGIAGHRSASGKGIIGKYIGKNHEIFTVAD